MSKPEIYLTELEEFNKRIDQIIEEQEKISLGAAKDEPQVKEALELVEEIVAEEPVQESKVEENSMDLIDTFVATYENHSEPEAILPTKKYYSVQIVYGLPDYSGIKNIILDSAVVFANSFAINPTTAREWFKKKKELSNERYTLKLSNYGE